MVRARIPITIAAAFGLGCSGPTDTQTSQANAGSLRASASGGPVIHQVSIGGPDVCAGFGAKPGCDANFSLIALQRADGSVEGQWIDRLSQNFGGGGIFVEVTCLAIDGNTAWVGGVVKRPDGLAGAPAMVYARDRGTSANEPADRFLTLYDQGSLGLSTNCQDKDDLTPFLLRAPQGQVTIK